MNKSCMSKLWWKLHHGGEELWCRVVWGKYGRDSNMAWESKWIGHDVRISDMDVSIPLHLRNANIACLIDVDDEWNWEMINKWLPESITCRIASMLPPSIDVGSECCVSIGVHGN
ncbi:hypothetical protein KIW84_076613 [Lathyrus oleraceus]|uniref:Uncharacterized protein n=1 Tax=Pisum sativum TaxID=3888 RepID=A0A9D4VYQ9_PEA|nr:hypothetical protein KIW84_076613 [Pisum sativum]